MNTADETGDRGRIIGLRERRLGNTVVRTYRAKVDLNEVLPNERQPRLGPKEDDELQRQIEANEGIFEPLLVEPHPEMQRTRFMKLTRFPSEYLGMTTNDEINPKNHVTLAAGGEARFGSYVLDEFGAPKLSELNVCRAPDLPEWPNHLGAAILNSVFVVTYKREIRRYLLNFIRRMETAVGEYRLGRRELLNYVEQLPVRNNHFLAALRALSHFEQSAAALYQAAILLTRIKPGQLFNKGDGSSVECLNKIYNRSKHFEEGGTFAGAAPATPIWLTNEGLECSDAALTFVELHEMVVELTKCAEVIAVRIPRRLQEE